MKKTIIVNIGISNLKSVEQACVQSKINYKLSNNKDEIENADAIIFPGNGSFYTAITKLHEYKLYNTIIDHIKKNKPYLGICLGFQLLFEFSNEIRKTNGLGIFKGFVDKLNYLNPNIIVPHVGWKKILFEEKNKKKLMINIQEMNCFFTHSYCVLSCDEDIILSKSYFGEKLFVSSIIKDNLIATQFHPENSSEIGLVFYKNFRSIL